MRITKPTRIIWLGVASVMLCAGLLSLTALAQNAPHRLSMGDVLKLLNGQVSPHRVSQRARQQGIDFQVTPEVERQLRRAGATDELLAALRELAPKAVAAPATVVVETSPGAQVYLDDVFKGEASLQGRLVIENAKGGEHSLRVTLAGKKNYEQPVTVLAGQETAIEARLEDIGPPPPGTVRENPKDGLKYVWIPPGTFMMGCSAGDSECFDQEKPAHQVTITKGFWIGQTPVTVGAYKRFAEATGRQMPPAPNFNNGWTNEDMPIVNVSWNDAQAYCGWMGGRLPTEAEWEYAARGGSTEARYGSIDEVAWYSNNSGGQTHDVAQKRRNGFGLFDMLGNVWQWVNDWYDEKYYQNSPPQDPPGPTGGQLRVLRGGSWGTTPGGVRVAGRFRDNPVGRYDVVGLRCGREVE
jgi:formylglycine-generating enzyme required for sulfatase activity